MFKIIITIDRLLPQVIWGIARGETSFSLMFPLVLVQVVEKCYIMLLLYSEHLQNAFLSDVFPLELPFLPRVREDLRHTSACDRGKHF